MKTLNTIILLLFISLNTMTAQVMDSCNFFLIKEKGNGVEIVKTRLYNNKPIVFQDEALLSYVMVFEPGSKSGELLKHNEKLYAMKAVLSKGIINISILYNDGTEKAMPPLDVMHARKMSARVNITGNNGYKQAFRVDEYEYIAVDNGPVIDIFSGMIPLEKGDYSLMTETHEAKQDIQLSGKVPIIMVSNWMVVECKLPNGKEERFIVDFGAENTIVTEDILEESAEIRPFQMVEHSSEGTTYSKASVGGATGQVENILGISTLPEFTLGDITLENLDVTVLSNFPEGISKHGISGIIGRDILEKTEFLTINNLNDPADAEIVFSDLSSKAESADHSIAFSRAGGHYFIDGEVNNEPISFLIDTGAGKIIIDQEFVKNNDIPYSKINSEKKLATGLDGKGIEFSTILIKNVSIGGIQYSEMQFDLADMFVFEKMGLQNDAVILGMSFFNNFGTVEFNFGEKKLNLWE